MRSSRFVDDDATQDQDRRQVEPVVLNVPSKKTEAPEPPVEFDPLRGLEQEPLVGLLAAVRDLPVKDVTAYARRALKALKHPLDEAPAAIYLYTMQWNVPAESLYAVLNTHLRAHDAVALVPFRPFLRLLMFAFDALAPRKCDIWRAVGCCGNDLKAGDRICWWAFTSCAEQLDSVAEFIRFKGGQRVIFHVHAETGRDVRAFSQFPKETEVVLLPGTELVVKSVLPSGDTTIVELQEVVSEQKELHKFLQTHGLPLDKLGRFASLDELRKANTRTLGLPKPLQKRLQSLLFPRCKKPVMPVQLQGVMRHAGISSKFQTAQSFVDWEASLNSPSFDQARSSKKAQGNVLKIGHKLLARLQEVEAF